MMAPQSLALQQCFDEVADSAPMALDRCLSHVVSVLQEAEGSSLKAAERLELGDAWRELKRHQASWCKRYPEELRAAFELSTKDKVDSPSANGRFSPKLELTLVDDDEIVGAIESSRLVQHVMPLVERPVSELDALVSTAMGLTTVRPELNPIRPEVFAQSLRALIGRTDVKAATGSLWMKYMAEPLGQELQTLYGRLVTQLKDANVQAAQYRVTGQPSAPSGASDITTKAATNTAANAPAREVGAPAATGGPSPAGTSSGYSPLSSRQITHALLRDFLVNGAGPQASQALPVSYYAEVDRELAELKSEFQLQGELAPPEQLPGYRDMQAVDRPQRAVGVRSTLDKQIWGDYAQSHERSLVHTRLRRDATQVAQVLGLELVRKVVNQIAQDPRLLAPVREAIVALEPSLLRLAMVDPRFFSDENHPGRWLMESVAKQSFKYNDEFGSEFKTFFDGVCACFNVLNRSAIPSAQPFEDALSQLEAAWATQERAEEGQRGQAVDAMKFAELRQAEADNIAWELSSRPDLDGVPQVVQDFLFGPWTLVLAHARLTAKEGQLDPHGFRDVISDLLWSVKPEVTLKQPAQLFERVPRLVGRLRTGLASLGQGPDENEAFFQDLMKLHRPVLKLRRAKTRRDARESGVAPLAVVDEVAGPVLDAPAKTAVGLPWMSPQELDAAGFEETLPSDMAELMPELEPAPSFSSPSAAAPLESSSATRVAAKAPAAPPDIESILANLREGDWVDLYSKRRWLRAKLTWASTKATLFMFVSHGGQPHSMTRRICERLIRDRFLRPVRMHGVVARALDALNRDEATA